MNLFKKDSLEELEYKQYFFNRDLHFIRVMLILSVILYSSYGILDYLLEVKQLHLFYAIRFQIVAPFVLSVIFLSYTKIFFTIYQYILTMLFVVASLGIVTMLIIDPEQHSYYGGLFLVFSFAYTLLRIKWQFATIGTIIIILTYLTMSKLYLPDQFSDALVFSSFYIGFAIISTFGSFTFAQYRKERYLRENLLEKDKVILERKNDDNLLNLDNSNRITVYAFARLAESRDVFTGEHIDRVGELSLKLAMEISEDIYYKNEVNKEEFIKTIELASTLHDIGKAGISELILMKPGRLTEAEREIMKNHCYLGASTLTKIKEKYPNNSFVNMGIEICNGHHENWDGSGYPKGLIGSTIPLSARIVAIVDVYDALISERPYKLAYTKEKTINEIMELKGLKFDPDIVDAFLKII